MFGGWFSQAKKETRFGNRCHNVGKIQVFLLRKLTRTRDCREFSSLICEFLFYKAKELQEAEINIQTEESKKVGFLNGVSKHVFFRFSRTYQKHPFKRVIYKG